MQDDIRVRIQSVADIVHAREQGRLVGRKAGFSGTDQTVIATAISEVARNILTFAMEGEITIQTVSRNGQQGVEITAKDIGPGIPDISRAMQDGYSTGKGLGVGLPGARRLMDEFLVISAIGKGTTVTMTKWVNWNDGRRPGDGS